MIVVGVGCSLGCPADELVALVRSALRESGADAEPVATLATVDRRAGEPGVTAAAARLGGALRTFTAAELSVVSVPTPSAVVKRHVGTPSVAEAAALLGADADELLLEKRRSAHATCALARARPEGPR